MADGIGNLIGWEETGLVEGKQWITAKDDKVSDVCNANGGMGVIGLHEPFSHGALTIPEHPNGRCAVVPVVGRTGKLAKGSRAMETGDGRQVSCFRIGRRIGEFAETKELRKAAMQYARDNFVGKSYVNESSGHELKVTWQGVKHAASKSNSIELSLMVALDKVLMNAKYEGSFPNKLGRDHIIAVHKYSTGVRFVNKVLKIRIIAREKFDGIKHYDHFILKDK